MLTESLGLSGLLKELLAETEPPKSANPAMPCTERPAERAQDAIAQSPATVPQPQATVAQLQIRRCGEIKAADEMKSDGIAGLLDELEGMRNDAPAVASASAADMTISRSVSWAAPVPRPWARTDRPSCAAFTSVAQDENIEFRPYMEDGHTVIDPFGPVPGLDDFWAFYAVYDGHGGRDATDYCESKLDGLILAELMSNGGDAPAALTTAYAKIDSQLALLGAWSHGTTATTALIQRRTNGTAMLHVANVGDSRALLVGVDRSMRVSTDHRPRDPEEERRIREEGGKVVKGRVCGDLAVSRSLGDHRLKQSGVSSKPALSCSAVASGYVLVMASDGLWDVVSDEEVAGLLEECIQEAKEAGGQQDVAVVLQEKAAQVLVTKAKDKGSRDNILVLLVFL